MKKIKIFILCLFFVALGTVGSVAGFYINENSTAVVNWLNNSITVSNDNYKELLEESKLTVLQLSLEIASLEEENAQLQIEKEDLTNIVAQLEQTEEDNQELIQDYTLQISSLDAQISEKDSIIADLQSLINSIYEDLITELFVLPDDLKDKTFNVISDGEDFVVNFSDGSVRFLDCSEGELSIISQPSDYTSSKSSSVYIFESGYLILKQISSSASKILFYSKITHEETSLFDSVSGFNMIIRYEEGLFFGLTNFGTYYFDSTTVSLTKCCDMSIGGASGYSLKESEDKILINGTASTTSYKARIGIFDKATKLGAVYEMSGDGCRFKSFIFNNSGYVVVGSLPSSLTVYGLYKVEIEGLELIYQFESQTSSYVGDLTISKNVAIFSHASVLYSFNGQEVSVIEEATWFTSQVYDPTTLLLETDNAQYYSFKGKNYMVKLSKLDESISFVNMGGTCSTAATFVSDGRALLKIWVSGSNSFYLFNPEDDTLVSIVKSNYLLEYGGYLYYKSSSYLYSYELATGTKKSILSTSTEYSSLNVFDDVFVFSNFSSYLIYCPTRTVLFNKVSNTYDSTMSNIEERTFYKKLSTLDNGIVYEKVVYNEDFTDYTKSVVIVK